MRVYVDCLVDGFKRGSDGFYRGNWDKVEAAVETIRGRTRGSVNVSAQRPGLLRVIIVDETNTRPSDAVIEAAIIVDCLIDDVASIASIELES
jgi:hypothetical protein